MRRTICAVLNSVLVVALLLVAVSSCSRAKPAQTPTAVQGGDESVAGATSTPADISPTPSMPIPSPTLALPTATPTLTAAVPTPTATPVVATPTAVPVTPTATVETSAPEATPVAPSEAPTAEGVATTEEVTYTVKWGDSLLALARYFDTTVEDIARLNGLTNTDFIRVGQTLRIQTVASAEPAAYLIYVVRRGDCLSAIAQRYGTSVEELRRINQIVNPWYIYVGQTLEIPSAGSQPDSSGTQYVVRPGDTLWHVAIRYGTAVWRISIANNIRNPNLIYPGQVLVIP